MSDATRMAPQFFAQSRMASLRMEQLEARILAKAKAEGVEAVVLFDEIMLTGKADDIEKVMAEGRRVLDV